jgi:hemerythrin-like metal-binding protein
MDEQLMPNRVRWEPAFGVGHAAVDAQHQRLFDQCNVLAEHCAGSTADGPAFDQAFEHFKALVREHRDTEAALLARGGYPDPEGHRDEFDEFEFVAAEVATTANFDRVELQRFLSNWCVGHVAGAAAQQGAFLAGQDAPT